jgi:hypothetical protein
MIGIRERRRISRSTFSPGMSGRPRSRMTSAGVRAALSARPVSPSVAEDTM